MPFRKNISWGKIKPPVGTPINFAHPLTQGLKAFWPFHEGAGLRVKNDVTAPQYDIAIGNFTDFSWTVGSNGLAINRGAGTTATALTPGTAITSTTTFSFACRLYLTSVSGDAFGALFANSAGTSGIWIKKVGATYVLGCGSGAPSFSTVLNLNGWNDIVVSCLAGSMSAYIGGVLDATVNAGVPSFSATQLMSDNAGTKEFVNGTLSYAGIWIGRALSQADAQTLTCGPFDIYASPKRRIINGRAASGGLLLRRRKAMVAA